MKPDYGHSPSEPFGYYSRHNDMVLTTRFQHRPDRTPDVDLLGMSWRMQRADAIEWLRARHEKAWRMWHGWPL